MTDVPENTMRSVVMKTWSYTHSQENSSSGKASALSSHTLGPLAECGEVAPDKKDMHHQHSSSKHINTWETTRKEIHDDMSFNISLTFGLVRVMQSSMTTFKLYFNKVSHFKGGKCGSL